MKKILFLITLLPYFLSAQVCTPSSNVVLFTNYDGGILNINVDVNIPNLKIGIVSYEAVQVNFSGPFVNNITEVRYAGYNSNNDNCNLSVTATSFSGLPVSAASSITFAPPATVNDPNGNNSIICAYSCNSGSNQGGCNTVNQVVAYFYQIFNVNSVYLHTIQYNCWTGVQNISTGGNCCPAPPPPPPPSPLTATSTQVNVLCNGSSTGSINLTVVGGTPPYTYAWSNNAPTQDLTNIPSGSYTVVVTDATGAQTSNSVTISSPPAMAVVGTVLNSPCFDEFGSIQLTTSGGVSPYTVNWNGLNPAQVPAGQYAISVQDANNCVFNYNFAVSEPTELSGDITSTPDLGNCEGTISIVVQGGTPLYMYSWDSLSGVSPNMMDVCGGEYCVEVTDANGCLEEFCEEVISLANIGDIDLPFSNSTIAPNPSIESTILTIKSAIQQPLTIRIVDVSGTEVFVESVYVNESNQAEISIAAPSGIYFINFTNEVGFVETLKWVRY